MGIHWAVKVLESFLNVSRYGVIASKYRETLNIMKML